MGGEGWRAACPQPPSFPGISLSCVQTSPSLACGEDLWSSLEAIPGSFPRFRQRHLPVCGLRVGVMVPGAQCLPLAAWGSLFPLTIPVFSPRAQKETEDPLEKGAFQVFRASLVPLDTLAPR